MGTGSGVWRGAGVDGGDQLSSAGAPAVLWRLLAGGVLGALVLVVINFFGGMVGFSIALNPFTAMAVGFLGLPGVGLLVALNLLL